MICAMAIEALWSFFFYEEATVKESLFYKSSFSFTEEADLTT